MSKNLLQQRQRHQQCIRASTGGAGLFSKHYVNLLVNKPPRSLCQRRLDDIQSETNSSLYSCIGLRTPTFINLDFKQTRPKCPNDYNIYQNANLATFFGAERKGKPYENVSDVCLLNDYYIFVKMPLKINVLSARNVQETNVDQKGQRPISEITGNSSSDVFCAYSKLPRCFKCNRSTRVSPIIEELEQQQQRQQQQRQQWKRHPESSNHGQNLVQSTQNHHCWHTPNDDVEVFQSRTRITRVAAVKQKQTTAPCSLVNKLALNIAHSQRNALVTSLHDVVQPELSTKLPTQHASAQTQMLLTQQTTPKTSKSTSTSTNNNNGGVGVGDVVDSNNSSRLSLGALHHWLLRTFGRKSTADDDDGVVVKKKKTKPPRIRAAVHKTYFVRWVKPPETQWHGYGVKRPPCQDYVNKSTLRRCRSAVY